MVATAGFIRVEPPSGLTIDVTITTGSGASVTSYTAQNGSTPHDNPKSVSSATNFHLTATGLFHVVSTFEGATVDDTVVNVSSYGAGPSVVAPVLDPTELANAVEDGQAAEDYSGAGSHQTRAADLTLAAGAGRDAADGSSFLAAFMGNVLGGALTKTANYLGGLIGHFSATSTASNYPAGGVLAGIGDGVNDPGVHGVVAYIDGDSETTIAGAAFKVMNNNSTVASGFHFGLDLQAAAHDGYQPVDKDFYLSAPVRLVEDVVELVGSGAPVDGTTGANVAGKGSRYTDVATGTLYINTNTKASPTWTEPAGSGASVPSTSEAATVVSKTTTYAAAAGEMVLANATGGAFTVTLPAVTLGYKVRVKKTDSSVNAVTVAPASGTIDGRASTVIGSQYESHDFVSDGTNWFEV